ncbi:MAG: aminotransferase class IV family protein [Rhizobiaceae bacterium]|nr:aminotransferase class IV family protein [Rhizobiaceae bacterium]
MPAESAIRDRHTPGYELIETLRWERANGFPRGGLHLERLRRSAEALGFDWRDGEAEAALDRAVADSGADMLRVRLTLDKKGGATCAVAPFSPLPADTIWRIGIARARLVSSDPLLRHKTTRRGAYEAARGEFASEEADEVLLLNEKGQLCEGTITSLFLDMGDGGPLLTPSLQCGLLAGVLRGVLIGEGKAREALLEPLDLFAARATYLGNSLRGLIRARTI